MVGISIFLGGEEMGHNYGTIWTEAEEPSIRWLEAARDPDGYWMGNDAWCV